jgi:hypothetical protein
MKKPTIKKPTTSEEWLALEIEISVLFDGAPIDEEDLFAGRSAEVRKIIETVVSRSKHAVLYQVLKRQTHGPSRAFRLT